MTQLQKKDKAPGDYQPILVKLTALLIFALAIYFLIHKIGLGQYIANDFFSMQNAFSLECRFRKTGEFSFLPRCLTLLTSYLYETPILYLSSILLISSLKFFFLLKIYQALPRETAEPSLTICIAAFALLLATVGGSGRFFLGSGNILVLADIYTRTWAQVFLLVGLFAFIKRRLILASTALGIALLLQALNVTNAVIVLGIAFFLSASSKERLRLPLLVSPFLIFFAYQYYLVYGIPSLSLSHLNLENAAESISTEQWYRYIYSQDPDDLSILFQFRQGWVSVGYVVFGFLGLCLGYLVEKAGTVRATLERPGMAIMVAGYLYITLCAVIEYFQAPIFVLEYLIVLQPRRVMYLPQLIATFYFASYTIQPFFVQGLVTSRRWATLVALYTIFSALIALSAWETSISPKITILYGIFLVGGLTIWFFATRLRQSISSGARTGPILFALMFLIISAKTVPHLSAKTLADFETLFLTAQPRDYAGYLSTVGRLSGRDKEVRDFFDMARFISALRSGGRSIISVGLRQKERNDFVALTGASISAVDPFTGARSGAHYNKDRLVQIAPILTQTSGLSLEEFIMLGRDKQTAIFEEFARRNIVRAPELISPMTGQNGLHSYFLFAGACPDTLTEERILYFNPHYCLCRPFVRPVHD